MRFCRPFKVNGKFPCWRIINLARRAPIPSKKATDYRSCDLRSKDRRTRSCPKAPAVAFVLEHVHLRKVAPQFSNDIAGRRPRAICQAAVPRCKLAQFANAPIGSTQMVAIGNLGSISGEQRLLDTAGLLDHCLHARCRVADRTLVSPDFC